MSDLSTGSRSERLDRALSALLAQTPEIEAAAVVSFDGLPMASALPLGMDEDRVAAMSAALLSLGERAAQGLGRGELSQVYIEGETGTVYLVSADDEAVLVAVAAQGAKAGMMMYEVRRTAATVADVLRADAPDLPAPALTAPAVLPPPSHAVEPVAPAPSPVLHAVSSSAAEPAPTWAEPAPTWAEPALAAVESPAPEPAAEPEQHLSPLDAAWPAASYAASGSVMPPTQHWS